VKLDYTKIPPNFWIRHNITPADGPQAIKEIFAQSEKLGYIDDTYKFTSRILYTQE
jgi:mannitol/fructose-specific phosphotransferase system IIA component (Ntr-type)